MKKYFSSFFITFFLIVISLVVYINEVEPFESFSLRFHDNNFNLQDIKPSKEVVLVAIDEKSVNKFGRWPWDRDIIAKGIDVLSKSNIVILDMIFSESTSIRKDLLLSKSISNLNNSICGFFLRNTSTQILKDSQIDILSDSSLDLLQSQIEVYSNPSFISAPYAEINIMPILESCTFSGSFSTIAEKDNLLRSYPISVYFDNLLYPSLGTQALRVKFNDDIKRVNSNEVKIDQQLITLDKKGFVKLNYYKKEDYQIVSFLDVVEQKIKSQYFKDKIVILGITEIGAGDIASTPIGAISGSLIHYTFISNILENHLIKEYKYITSFLIIFMILLPLLLVFIIKKNLHRFILYSLIYSTLYLITKYLFTTQTLYIDVFYPLISLLVSAIFIESLTFNRYERNTRFLKNAFTSYLSNELLDELIQNPDSLSIGGENKELTILFSDIRDFTSISETMAPDALVKILNRYFTPMTDIIVKNNGMLDKYIGDAIMAFFNAPINIQNHADAGCKAALEMIQKLDKLNIELKSENIKPLKIGIGINSDLVTVGNMGSITRFNYTVIGDGVNVASRVEGLTKIYGVDIIITDSTIKKLKGDFLYRKIESLKVKGKTEFITIYELMQSTKNKKELQLKYNKALKLFEANEFKEAKELFEILCNEYDDKLSKYFLRDLTKKVAL